MPNGRAWTKREERLLVKYRGMGMYFDEVAELLERTEKATRSRWKLLGLGTRRAFKPEEIATIKALHGKQTASQIAAAIGRPLASVYGVCHRLKLPRLTRQLDRPAVDAYIRARHAEQWSDNEIAAGWTAEHPGDPLDRRYVGELRNQFGLRAWAMESDRVRDRVRETTREQLHRSGMHSLAQVRNKAFLDFAARQGWPGIAKPRMVQILNFLYEQGPHTREQIAKAIGVRWQAKGVHPASRCGLAGNGPGGSYVAQLQRLGLVVRLGRNVRTGPKQGQAVNLYAIAPGVERGPISTREVRSWESRKGTRYRYAPSKAS